MKNTILISYAWYNNKAGLGRVAEASKESTLNEMNRGQFSHVLNVEESAPQTLGWAEKNNSGKKERKY